MVALAKLPLDVGKAAFSVGLGPLPPGQAKPPHCWQSRRIGRRLAESLIGQYGSFSHTTYGPSQLKTGWVWGGGVVGRLIQKILAKKQMGGRGQSFPPLPTV